MSEKRLPRVAVHRSEDRFQTQTSWLRSRHSFSFGDHYDPDNTHHGLLLAHNEEIISPGHGFDTHPHRDIQIVTWVLSGELEHSDSRGNSGVVSPGLVQCLNAGSRIEHAEKNAGADPVHYVQMWVIPEETGMVPSYQQAKITSELATGRLVTVVSGVPRYRDHTAIGMGNTKAALHAACLSGAAITLPEAPYLHVFVTRGEVEMEGTGSVKSGDAVRMSFSGGQRLRARHSAEVLVWEMWEGLGGL